MNTSRNIIRIGFLNIRGQTGFTSAKQAQIESFIVNKKLDVLHMQETHIEEDTFNDCWHISSCFNLISNNSDTRYGTASLISTSLSPENISLDLNGSVIVFMIRNISFCKSISSLRNRRLF